MRPRKFGFGIDKKPAPKKCLCGGKLSQPVFYKNWQVVCDICGSAYVWSFPNVWKERSALPLFDTKREIT